MKYTLATIYCLVVFVSTGCHKTNDQTTHQKTSTTMPTQGTATNVSNVVSVQGRAEGKVPLFSWTDEKGKTITIDEFAKGGGVLVNFWATWCGPCRKEIPDLIALNTTYQSMGVKIIGISGDRGDDAITTVSTFVSENAIAYPIIIDNGELAQAFGGIRGIPTTFFVDKNGTIKQRMIGLQSKETFARAMDAIKP